MGWILTSTRTAGIPMLALLSGGELDYEEIYYWRIRNARSIYRLGLRLSQALFVRRNELCHAGKMHDWAL
jgi:hypothetical protein